MKRNHLQAFRYPVLLTLAVVLSGCAGTTRISDQAGSGPVGQTASTPVAIKQAADLHAPSGTVVETMEAGGYCYVSIEKDGVKRWAAIPPRIVNVGDTLVLRPGIVMRSFYSKALNRSFEQIVFSDGPVESAAIR